MGDGLKCEIVRDLLPSYVDGLTSDVTNEEIKRHLQECEACSAALEHMCEPETILQETAAEEVREVDYLKKVRRRTGRMIVVGILAAVIVVTALFCVKVFLLGTQITPEQIAYEVTIDKSGQGALEDVISSGDRIEISGGFMGSAIGYARTVWSEEDGVVTADVYGALVGVFNDGSFTAEYEPKGEVRQVRLGHLVIWESGRPVARRAAEVYDTVTPYVGDISAIDGVAGALRIGEEIGGYTNELHTAAEPYGWSLVMNEAVAAARETAVYEKMKADSCVMIAAIENLGFVTWEYETEAGKQELTVTAEDASALAGRDIKECAETAADMQELMQRLGLL